MSVKAIPPMRDSDVHIKACATTPAFKTRELSPTWNTLPVAALMHGKSDTVITRSTYDSMLEKTLLAVVMLAALCASSAKAEYADDKYFACMKEARPGSPTFLQDTKKCSDDNHARNVARAKKAESLPCIPISIRMALPGAKEDTCYEGKRLGKIQWCNTTTTAHGTHRQCGYDTDHIKPLLYFDNDVLTAIQH